MPWSIHNQPVTMGLLTHECQYMYCIMYRSCGSWIANVDGLVQERCNSGALMQERHNSSVLTKELCLFGREYLPNYNFSDWKLLQKFGFESDCTLHAKSKVNAHQEKASTSSQSLCKYQLRDQPFLQFWSHNYVFKIKNTSTLGMQSARNLSLCRPVWANFRLKRNSWSK